MNEARIGTIVFLLFVSSLATSVFRNFANPVVILALPWELILLSQQLLAAEFPFGLRAAFVICAVCASFLLGSLLPASYVTSEQPSRSFRSVQVERAPVAPFLWRTLAALLAAVVVVQIGLTYYYLNLVGIGRYVDGGINPYAIYEAMGAAYGDISVVGITYRSSVAFTYICAGILALDAMRPRRGNFIAFAFLAIVAAQSVFVSTRTTFLLAVSVMAMTMLCAHVHRFRRISRSAISAILAMSLVAISTAAFASMRRYGLSVATISSNDFVDNQKVALLGAASNLSLFLDQTGIAADSEWTGITIAGVLGPLGLYERVAGVYIGSSGERQLTGESRQTTNQYTGLRLLLEDFGLWGTLVVMVILGMVVTHVFVFNKRRPSIARIIILGNCYLLLLWLPITLLSYYAFWTIQFLVLLPLAKVFFRIPIARYAGRTAAKRHARPGLPRDAVQRATGLC